MIVVFVFLSCVWTGHAALYHLNASEYARMPPLFRADSYDSCAARGGRYCTAKVHLISDGPSELMDMIQEFSSLTTHFNHSNLLHGICVTDACTSLNETGDIRTSLEACLNESLWRSYGLRARVARAMCGDGGKGAKVETVDMLVAATLASLLLLLIMATFKEVTERKSNKFLSCFSVVSNWRRLRAPSELTAPHVEGMKNLYGVRTLGTVWVICVHALLAPAIASENPRELEELMNSTLKYLSGSGVAINTFFIMSGCLLAYNLEVYKETSTIHWSLLLKKIVLRWLRLVTPLLIPLAIATTWFRFPQPLPYWQVAVGDQAESCASDWWKVLLMVVNYVPGSQCMIEMWYVSADMQLTILGLIVYVLVPNRARSRVLGALLVFGVLAPAVLTYLYDLDAMNVISPEAGRELFHNNPTFNRVYKPGHTNVMCYLQGLLLGAWVRRLQVQGFDVEKHQKFWHKYAFYCLYPMFLLSITMSSVYIANRPRASLFERTLFAALYRPAFGLIFCCMLLGFMLKLKESSRKFMSWHGFIPVSRVCYCAYAVHLTVVRLYAGTRTGLIHVSGTYVFLNLLCTTVVSLALAVPLWLAVEAPFAQVTKLTFIKAGWIPDPDKKKETTETKDSEDKITNKNNNSIVQNGVVKDSDSNLTIINKLGVNNECIERDGLLGDVNKKGLSTEVSGKKKTE